MLSLRRQEREEGLVDEVIGTQAMVNCSRYFVAVGRESGRARSGVCAVSILTLEGVASIHFAVSETRVFGLTFPITQIEYRSMRKLMFPLYFALVLVIALPLNAYSKGAKRITTTTPKPSASPTPAPSPTPPTTIQGTLLSVGPNFITMRDDKASTAHMFKVNSYTQVTINARPVTLAALKPGMALTLKPTPDQIYATSVEASDFPVSK